MSFSAYNPTHYAPSELSSTMSYSRPRMARSHSLDASLIRRGTNGSIDPFTGRRTFGDSMALTTRRARDDLRGRDVWEMERERERQARLMEWERERRGRRERERWRLGGGSDLGRRGYERGGYGGDRWRLGVEPGVGMGMGMGMGERGLGNGYAGGIRGRDDLGIGRTTEDMERLSVSSRRRIVSRPESVVSTSTTTMAYSQPPQIISRSPMLASRGLTPRTFNTPRDMPPPMFPMSTRGTLAGYHILSILGPLVIPTRLPVVASPAEIQGLKQRFLTAMMREAARSGGNGVVNFSIDAMGRGLFVGKGTVVVCVPENGIFEAGGSRLGMMDARLRERERMLRERERLLRERDRDRVEIRERERIERLTTIEDRRSTVGGRGGGRMLIGY